MSELLEELRRAGTHDSAGFFTLDRRRALEKMREFQLEDPHEYVLHLVAAAVAAGCRQVTCSLEPRQAEILLDGMELPEQLVEQPLAGLFIDQENLALEAWRELAIGLNAALAMEPGVLEISSSGRATRIGSSRMDVRSASTRDGAVRVRCEFPLGWNTLRRRF
ncbi:MAG: hypothetical protein ACYCW6_29030, partial [Candidatus Xenobia bacterium]